MWLCLQAAAAGQGEAGWRRLRTAAQEQHQPPTLGYTGCVHLCSSGCCGAMGGPGAGHLGVQQRRMSWIASLLQVLSFFWTVTVRCAPLISAASAALCLQRVSSCNPLQPLPCYVGKRCRGSATRAHECACFNFDSVLCCYRCMCTW